MLLYSDIGEIKMSKTFCLSKLHNHSRRLTFFSSKYFLIGLGTNFEIHAHLKGQKL